MNAAIRNTSLLLKHVLMLIVMLATGAGMAHAAAPDWEAGVRRADQVYWDAYNRRDADTMNSFLTKDVEFYHDRGGSLIGKAALGKVNDGMKTNNNRLRRVLVPGSMHVYPMRRGDEVYGAVVTGEHDFFITEPGKAEERAGRALFTHLMLLKNGQWKISRILSYEHADAK